MINIICQMIGTFIGVVIVACLVYFVADHIDI